MDDYYKERIEGKLSKSISDLKQLQFTYKKALRAHNKKERTMTEYYLELSQVKLETVLIALENLERNYELR